MIIQKNQSILNTYYSELKPTPGYNIYYGRIPHWGPNFEIRLDVKFNSLRDSWTYPYIPLLHFKYNDPTLGDGAMIPVIGNYHLVVYCTSDSARSSNIKHPYSVVQKFTTDPCGTCVPISCSCVDHKHIFKIK